MRLLAILLFAGAVAAARAADAPVPAPPAPDQVIYPAGNPARPAAAPIHDPWSRTPWLIGALGLAAGGAWWLMRLRSKAGSANPLGRKLALEETRSLGNRQYLVVAAYGDKRLLLGVTPGRIQLLCELDPDAEDLP